MNKFIVTIFAAMALVACGNSTSKGGAENDSTKVENTDKAAATNQSKEGAKAAVEAAYNSYFNPSDEEGQEDEIEGTNVIGVNSMGKFMTDALKEKAVDAYSKQVESEDIFFDHDVWINAQDFVDLTLVGAVVLEYKDEKARVEVKFKNFGEDRKAVVDVVYDKEKDTWLINDFIDPTNKTSLMKMMEKYLAE